MSTCPTQIEYRPLRAPQEDGTILADPPLDEVARLLEENTTRKAEHRYDFHGRSMAQLAEQARGELLAGARRWTTAYRDVEGIPEATPRYVILAGHQPELPHPGVWLKSFVLDHLVRRHGALGVNLVIDSDAVKATSLPVPGGSASDPRTVAIPMDRPDPKIPYEERGIVDRELFAGFARRVSGQISPLVANPLIDDFWPRVQEHARHTDNLAACLAQARHQLEGDWGVHTLEMPQSHVCRTESFCWFAAHLLARIETFANVYNAAAEEYRRVHRIRNAAHPVPNLAVDEPWFEAPLWIWTSGDPRRRRLFVCRRRGHIRLSDRGSWEIEVPLPSEGGLTAAVQRLQELPALGVKIRSRALLTTLWARLVLGDLFVHGIGGAKYDQVTDQIIRRFFHLHPPGLMVLSGTLRLPIDRPRVSRDDARRIRQQLRALRYHPEAFVNGQPTGMSPPGNLIDEKRRWIRTPQTPQNAQSRYRAIRQLNESLQPWVEDQRQRLLHLEAEISRNLEIRRVLAWRQYAFCLHSEENLREFFAVLLPKSA